jgi:hypothetical protein
MRRDCLNNFPIIKQPYKELLMRFVYTITMAEEVGCAYVDDEGLLKGLSMNPLGSAISFLFGNTPHLVGNIVIVGKSDGEGYDTDIPDYLLTLIKNISAKEELVA